MIIAALTAAYFLGLLIAIIDSMPEGRAEAIICLTWPIAIFFALIVVAIRSRH